MTPRATTTGKNKAAIRLVPPDTARDTVNDPTVFNRVRENYGTFPGLQHSQPHRPRDLNFTMPNRIRTQATLISLVFFIGVAVFTLGQMCLQRPTLITLTTPEQARILEADGDKFIHGPFLGTNMLVVDKEEFTTDFYGFTYSGTTEELIDTNVYLLGSWATDELEFMKMVVETTKGTNAKVLDIGANVGTHSMFISKYAGEVHAIEPWPPILERLNDFVTRNGVKNIRVHPVGYAAENGVLPYHQPTADNPGTGSFSSSRFPAQTNVIDLPLVVGDEHLAQEGISGIDLIKIDIEGYEKPALAGLKATIERDRPTVLIELNVSNEEGIKTSEELRALFPSDYTYLELLPKTHRRMYPWVGGKAWLCRCDTKAYRLADFDMNFDQNGPMVIAAPPEHAASFY